MYLIKENIFFLITSNTASIKIKKVSNYVSKSNAVKIEIKYLYSLKKIRIRYTNF